MESFNHQEIIKGSSFWKEEIERAGLLKKLPFFNDVITEKRPPHSESGYSQPIITDVVLDNQLVDIYHSDHLINKAPILHRIFLHLKQENN